MAALILILGMASFAVAEGNRYLQFNNDLGEAYASYRMALFQTNKNDAEKSEKANMSFLKKWEQIQKTYSDNPPEVYSADSKWQSTLTAVSQIAEKGAEQIKNGSLEEAHETLEQIRDELSELRKRNSVIAFSDHVNKYHEVMEEVLAGNYSADRINAGALETIRCKLELLQYLAQEIRENAPAVIKAQEKYLSLENRLFQSLDNLEKSLENSDPESVSKAIMMLKPAYAILFVNFG